VIEAASCAFRLRLALPLCLDLEVIGSGNKLGDDALDEHFNRACG
jgi:hypothetical protein